MVDFRKLVGMAAASLLFSSLAFGQLCSTTNSLALAGGLTNNIRAEGQTELIPQLTLTCSSTSTAASNFNLLVQIPNVPITSKVTATSTNTTEVSLVAGSNVFIGTGVTSATVFGTLSGNVISFNGVVATPTVGGTAVTFTISNIRVNASALPNAGAFPTAITAAAFVQGNNATTTGQSTGSGLAVAYAFNAIKVPGTVYTTSALATTGIAVGGAVTSSPNYAVCTSTNTTSTTGGAAPNFYIGLVEAFAGALKTQTDEKGPGTGASTPTSGTRVKFVFNNVPTGLSIYMPITVSNGVDTLQATSSETGAFSAITAATTPAAVNTSGLFLVPVSGTSATAIYEVTVTPPTPVVNTLAFSVDLVASGNTITNYLTNPTLTVTTSLAPQPATAASQIPSFSSTASDIGTANTVTFKPCTTTLLFPFVTNANGFETGIAISNTNKDPFSIAAQNGTCNLTYYASGVSGATNPAATIAPNLAEGASQPFLAGENYAFTLTQALGVNASNPATFQGYMIAQCNFINAHAFAYILGGLQPGMFVNPNNTAMGYLALVLTRGGGQIETVTY
jgi:hypothetical protein